MDDDEKSGLAEIDAEVDSERKIRRSSILKPQKPRNPFSTLDFSEANPDNTFARATRRVSFASSNFVKPFAADPEKNTIWDNTYEEEVNHTDSTKSSCDQTQGTKNSDFLNTTSLYSASAGLCRNQKNPSVLSATTECINIDFPKLPTVNEITNPGESLVSLARKLRSKSIQQYDNDTMEFTLINKTTEFLINKESENKLQENVPKIACFNKVRNISSATTLVEATMEMTACVTDKENVNPLINDLSLVVPRRNCLGTTNTTKYFIDEDMECTKEDFSGITSKDPSGNIKTVYFDDSANAMELTTMNKSVQFKENQTTINKSKRKTIIFDEKEGKMDFTLISSSSDMQIKENVEQKTAASPLELKNKTIIFNQSENDLQFTATMPGKIQSNVNMNNFQKRDGTIHFNDSEQEMEFTNTFSSLKNTKDIKLNTDLKQTGCFEKSQQNMEFNTSVGRVNVNSTISQVDDMEITTALSTELIEKKITETERNTTKFEKDMELTSTLQINTNKLKSFDMSLTQNLQIYSSSNIPTINMNNPNNADCKMKISLEEHPDNTSNQTDTYRDSTQSKSLSSNSPLNINNKSVVTDNLDNNKNASCSSPNSNVDNAKNVSLTTENVQQSTSCNTIDHQGPVNDIPILNVSKSVNNIKRHIIDSEDGTTIKKRNIQHSLIQDVENPLLSESSTTKPVDFNITEKNKLDSSIKTDSITKGASPILEHNLSTVQSNQNINLQTSSLSNSNILYSEPMKLKTKTSKFVPIPDLSANLNLEGTLNVDHITPATSFHLNLSTMSPCIEDTQQLIHATFSKPETLRMLNKDSKGSFTGLGKAENVSKVEENSQRADGTVPKVIVEKNEPSFTKDVKPKVPNLESTDKLHLASEVLSEKLDINFIKMSNESFKNEKSCFLEDITPLVPEEFDNSGVEGKSPNLNNSDIKTSEQDDTLKNTSNFGNYSLRSQLVLTNIEKYLLLYEPKTPQMNLNLPKLIKEFKENCSVIKSLCKSKPHITDLEEKYKRDMEESLSSVNEVLSTDEDSGVPSALGLIVPKTIQERICDMAKKTKKFWEFVKVEDDYYYFYTLFRTLPFKVHIHSELGIVYNLETYSNLSDLSQPVCWYELKFFKQKLKMENLLSVLGAKFDIFALMDYIYMSMEEIINFHIEYKSLAQKYGKSHHFRMNPDHSITFEILNIKQIICWIITVNMPITNLVSITKEDITAVHKVGLKLNEEHIKIIAENTPKGPNFLRNFIENVDEFVNRIGRRVKK